MKFFNCKKNIFCIIMSLAMLFSTFNIAAYANSAAEVRLNTPTALQMYEPGDKVTISGTAKGLGEVAVAVKNSEDELVFAAQPKVISEKFSTCFTLDGAAAEGKYTVIIGSMELPDIKENFIVGSSYITEIDLKNPIADTEYKPGDKVEISGTAVNVNSLAVCVRNNKDGRVFVDQPAVINGTFNTKFNLPNDVIPGKYNIAITAFGLKNAQNYPFKVTSSGSGGGGSGGSDDDDAYLTIGGNGVDNKVSFSLEDLKAMRQERVVFSVTSDLPEDLVMAAEGIPLMDLLNKAGLKNKAKMITFKGSDGYTSDFTVDQLLNQSRYIFPDKEKVEPMIALKRVERSSDYSDMTDNDAPVLCFGQRAKTDQTLFSFVKRLKHITVSTSSPKQWDEAEAKITAPNSKTKTATNGGKVTKGSKVYLECKPGGKIYYTTDGSIPNLDSKIFNPHGCGPNVGKYDPIEINRNTVVRAMVVGNGKTDSDVVTYNFKVPGSSDSSVVVEHSVSQSNVKKEQSDMENGRKMETLTLLPDIKNDIEKGEQGCRLVIPSDANVDEVKVVVSAEILEKTKSKGIMLGIDTENGSYTLPSNSVAINEIANELDTKAEKLNLNIIISKAEKEVKNKLKSNIQSGQQMMTSPLKFTVNVTAPNAKKKELKYFGGTYVERSIILDSDFNYNKATGVVWNENEAQFEPVPTRFEKKNGKMQAVILSRTNSYYTVLQADKTFADISNNWAKDDIELLASKMLISGRSESAFEPDSNVTRAEFATLLVRALGLGKGTLQEGQYTDVPANSWYADSIASATEEKIITGYGSNQFKPNKNITRQEMAVMIVRAARVAGINNTLSDAEQSQLLAQLKDNVSVSDWAKKDIAFAVKTGLMTGMPDKTFSPDTYADRAQSAAIIKRLMIHMNFMNVK